MDSLSFVMILRHLAFVKNLRVDFLLFRVVEDNMGVVFHFAFVLVERMGNFHYDPVDQVYCFVVILLFYSSFSSF